MNIPSDLTSDNDSHQISGPDHLLKHKGPPKPHERVLHDPEVLFEEYTYYASLTRAEKHANAKTDLATVGLLQVIFPSKSGAGVKPITVSEKPAITAGNESPSNGDSSEEKVDGAQEKKKGWTGDTIAEAEWTNASRAVRTASGAACFYLITTDVLGPFGLG
jgi:hypothetical protein